MTARTSNGRLLRAALIAAAAVGIFAAVAHRAPFDAAICAAGLPVALLGAPVTGAARRQMDEIGEYLGAIPDLIVRVCRDGTYLGYLGGAAILRDYDPAPFLGKTIAQTLPPDAADALMRQLARAFATGRTQLFECRLQVLGVSRRFAVRVTPAGSRDAMLMVREIELAESTTAAERALAAALEAMPLAICAVDPGGAITGWNRAAEQLLGWKKDEAVARGLAGILDEDLGAVCARLHEAELSEALDGVETRAIRRDDTIAGLALWRAPLRDESGMPVGSLLVAADISGRKALERQLQQAQRMEAVGRLAGGVAHDFNNLLTVITGYAFMLLEDLASQPSLRGNADEILRAVERASALTNQLLAFSRRQIVQPKSIELNGLVLNMDKMLRRVIGEDIELVTALSPDAGKIHADPGQIEQVIMNLVVNARDAMPEGGRITIETANATLDEEYARLHLTARPGEYVMLTVIDTGHGMDDQTRARIFEPFFTTKEQGKGTGLGLATVYGIVKQGGGEITVTSVPGQGTRFHIYLPRVFSAATDETPQPPQADVTRGTETVLLVEDEDDVRRLVSEVLAQQGYTVLEAAQPQQALSFCETYRDTIDLLLTDVVMPQMSGRELAERAGWIRTDMKVLFMSGYTEDPILGGSIADMEAPFLRKPFTPATLMRKIREVLDGDPQEWAAARH